MVADGGMLDRIAAGVTEFSEERHLAVARLTRTWGKDTAVTDKALRNCLLGTALRVIEGMRVKRNQQMEAVTEIATAGFSGYAIGRELLGTESARPSYSASEAEEKDNAVRIHDRSESWTSDELARVLKGSEPLMRTLHSQAYSAALSDFVGAKQARATLTDQLIRSIAVAMAEEDLFGPFPGESAGP